MIKDIVEKMKMVKVLYTDLTLAENVGFNEIKDLTFKEMEVYGRLFSEDEHKIKILTSCDFDCGNEFDCFIIPKPCIVEIKELSE